MRKATKKLLSLAMSAVMAVSVCPAVNVAEVKADDNPVVLRFLVASDTHMAVSNGTEATRFKNMFKSAYEYAGKQSYKKIDAAILVGDIVDRGRASEYTELKKTMSACNIDDETQVYMTMGNHEWWAYTNDKEKDTGMTTFVSGLAQIPEIDNAATDEHGLGEFSVNIKGYQFIGMSPENYNDGRGHDVYGTAKYTWMKSEVEKAKSSDATKPIFTFQHHPVNDTVYGSGLSENLVSGKDEQTALNECYKDSPQVINFSGHSHTPINTPTGINQTTYTQYTTGSMTSIYLENDASTGRQPATPGQIGQYTIVEVTADKNVKLIPYNILTDDFFKTPLGSTSVEQSDLIYEINVNDTGSWRYTTEKREKIAPYFEKDDKVTYKAGKITIDQAKDDTGVYLYEIEVMTEGKSTKTRKIFSDWYYPEMPAKLTYALDMLEVGKTYTVNVYPIDFFKNKGKAISTTFVANDIEEKIEAPEVYTKEYFADGTFEGPSSYWDNKNNYRGNACYTTEKARTGTYAGKVMTSNDMLVVNLYNLEAEKKYEFSMWMYIPENVPSNAAYQFGVTMTHTSNWGPMAKSEWDSIKQFEKGKWFKYTYKFEFLEDRNIAQITISSMAANAVAYVDDISVKRYHDCKAVDVDRIEPTYDKEGMEAGKKCPICGKIYEGCATIPKLERPTTAPETTTKAPETTTKVPETTTKVPETTTKAPETTTKAPETTTKMVQPTTTKKVLDKTNISGKPSKKLSSKKVKISFKKVKKAKKYTVQFAVKKNFKKVLYSKTVKNNKVTITSSKLKNKKRLYVRVRAVGAKKWSKVVTIKVKK